MTEGLPASLHREAVCDSLTTSFGCATVAREKAPYCFLRIPPGILSRYSTELFEPCLSP